MTMVIILPMKTDIPFLNRISSLIIMIIVRSLMVILTLIEIMVPGLELMTTILSIFVYVSSVISGVMNISKILFMLNLILPI